ITTKKVDENGKTITETYIAEGDEPAKILEGMAVNPEIIQRVDVTNAPSGENGERLFLYRNAGDKVYVEGTLNENITEVYNGADGNKERIIVISKGDGKGVQEYKVVTNNEGSGHGGVWVNGYDKNSNCAALGVYVVTDGEKKGSRISSLIDEGGAQEAGLKEGDIITRIEEFDVEDFPTLHLALSHFQPGDVVTVRYNRGDDSKKSKVELKDWNQLPGHEWRSRGDCGQAKTEETPAENIITQPAIGSNIQKLDLQEALIFPNPTEGLFAFSFRTEPGPVTVAITDVNGKVVYQEDNDNASGMYKKEIDLKGLPQGNYIVSVTQGDKVFTEQISKQ
ncbi:MAG TPA: T9SS type A sorting domain-containing protein, partial [Saprospiraceae bacterium]|nr:T9SS type A sorting domain-containing protein [Saprospiraceae bacterium]